MMKQSATPSLTSRAATAAAALGLLPYTSCHAHTRRPPARSAPTSVGVNCDQYEPPSPDFTKTVVIPCAWAWATMALGSPPFALLTYQIHMPLPSKAVPFGRGAGAGAGEGA